VNVLCTYSLYENCRVTVTTSQDGIRVKVNVSIRINVSIRMPVPKAMGTTDTGTHTLDTGFETKALK